jgi:hypothetical protein
MTRDSQPTKPEADEFEGYRLNDITYCIDPRTKDFFPVRVVRIGRRFFDVVAFDDDLAKAIAPEFSRERKNRRFVSPKLPSMSRFGGCDERTINSGRVSCQELRILPYHYWTNTGDEIIERNLEDANKWPMPTGTVYERWFKLALQRLRPDEHDLSGEGDKATQSRIQQLVSRLLHRVSSTDAGRSVRFRDPQDRRYWELTYPRSEVHGGGPAHLAEISYEAARRKYDITAPDS